MSGRSTLVQAFSTAGAALLGALAGVFLVGRAPPVIAPIASHGPVDLSPSPGERRDNGEIERGLTEVEMTLQRLIARLDTERRPAERPSLEQVEAGLPSASLEVRVEEHVAASLERLDRLMTAAFERVARHEPRPAPIVRVRESLIHRLADVLPANLALAFLLDVDGAQERAERYLREELLFSTDQQILDRYGLPTKINGLPVGVEWEYKWWQGLPGDEHTFVLELILIDGLVTSARL